MTNDRKYNNRTNYRKIYEINYGPIPKDNEGRSFDIHHKDGNRKNNDITNLQCISIIDHYNIHYNQGDYGACILLSKRIKLTPKEYSILCSVWASHRDGENNPMFGRKHTKKWKDNQSERKKEQYRNGFKNPMLGKKHKEETKKLIGSKSVNRKWPSQKIMTPIGPFNSLNQATKAYGKKSKTWLYTALKKEPTLFYYL